ncbi:MAG: hydrogenase maturation protease [Chloroflexaceae bacterium]
MSTTHIELTSLGYLHVPADVAERYFPHNMAVALPKGRELWLLPTCEPGAGRLLLKQRNARGDRSVLIWELLPSGTPPGPRPAFWDERGGALRVAL